MLTERLLLQEVWAGWAGEAIRNQHNKMTKSALG